MRFSAVAAILVFSMTISAPVRSSITTKLPLSLSHHLHLHAHTVLLPLRGGGRRARKFITKDKKAAHTRKLSRTKAAARAAEVEAGGAAGGEVREGEEGGGNGRVPEDNIAGGAGRSRASWIRNPRLRERFLRRHRMKQGAASEDELLLEGWRIISTLGGAVSYGW
jgi:hypothetical protein